MKQKFAVSFIIVCTMMSIVFFSSAPQAYAQFGGVVTDIGHTAVTIGQKIADVAEFAWTKGSKIAEDAWKKAGAIAYRNGMSYFLGQFARDAAMRISGGCSGQQPCFKFDKNYWQNLGDGAFGDMLDTLAKEGGFLDNGLCEPFDPALKLNLTLNVGKVSPYRDQPARKPKCSFSDIKKNIKETSLKNLVDFEFKLNRTSTLSRYKSEITDIIKNDKKIGDAARARLLKVGETLQGATDVLTKVVEDLSAQKLDEAGANKRFVSIISSMLDAGVLLNKNYIQTYNFGYLYYGDSLKLEDYFRQIYISKEICPASYLEDPDSPCATVANEVALYFQIEQERTKSFLQPSTFTGAEKYIEYLESLTNNPATPATYGYAVQENFFSTLFSNKDFTVIQPFCVRATEGQDVCKTQINEYLNRFDGWFKELYGMVDTMNDDRRRGALKPTTPGSELADLSKMFNPESNPIGAQLKLTSEANNKAAKEVEKSKYFQGLQGVTDSITSTVSGVVKTPSTLVNALGVESLKQSNNQFAQYTGVAIADAVGIFTNTLVSQLVKKYYDGPGLNTNLATAQQATQKGAIPALGGVKVAQKRFASLAAPAYKSATSIDAVTLLSRSSSSGNGFTEYNENIIDSGFAEAVKQELTVKEAIEKNLLHADWKFGYEKKDIEPKVGNGYPYRSLALLRHYRIIPVSWELAAEYINRYDSPKTLGDLMFAFDKPAKNVLPIEGASASENATGMQINLPSSKDYTRDFYVGQSLIFVPNDDDAVQCTTRVVGVNPGTVTVLSVADIVCGGSTLVVPREGKAGKVVPFSDNPYFGLINPQWVLKAPQVQCAATGAGEQIISRQEEENKSDPKKAKSIAIQRADYCADEQTCVLEDDKGNCKRYGYCTLEKYQWQFGDQNKACRPEYASCETFKDSKKQQVSYLKSTLDTTGCKDDSSIGCRELLRVSNPDVKGMSVPKISSSIAIQLENTSTPLLDSAFTSIPGTEADGVFWCTVAGGARCQIGVGEDSCEIRDAGGELVSTCSVAGSDANAIIHLNAKAQSCKPTSAGCQRYVRVVPKRDDQDKLILPSAGQITQLITANAEQGDYSTEVEGFRSTEELFLNSKRAMCRGTEAIGCQAFIPHNTSNPVTVYAKLVQGDQCVAQCVGFNDYIESPTRLDPGYKTVSFIPIGDNGGKVCNATAVGCEEFTNVNAENLGTSEAREYYTNTRWCANVSQTVADSEDRVKKRYFVWEGADIFGFQLRAVDLLQSNINNSPCTNPAMRDEGTVCADTVATQAVCSPDTTATNPDCREFIDSQGRNVFILQSKTVPVSNDCRLLRRTTTGERMNILPSASAKCSATDNMCRRYEGPKAGNVQMIFKSDFNTGTSPWEGGMLATESDGETQSLALPSGTGGAKLPSTGFSSILQTGREYSVTILYKISSASAVSSFLSIDQYPRVTLPYGPAETDVSETLLIPDNEWHTATLGPLVYKNALSDEGMQSVNQFVMYFSYPDAGSARLLIDQIQMSTRTDVFYRVRDSWSPVPKICIDQAYQGCSAYSTRMPGVSAKTNVYLYKFSQPCPESDVGCEALINTNNNTAIEEEVHFEGEDRLTLIPQDFVEVVKVTPEAQCQSSEMGCMLYAQPNIENKQQSDGALSPALVGFNPVALIERPDQYDRIVCSEKSSMCQQYTVMKKNQDGKLVESGTALFKAPQGQVCEFNGDAWLIKGTSSPCPVATLQPIGARSSNEYTQPSDGYAGLCPQQEASCTEVREEKDLTSQFITLGTGLQNGAACTDIDLSFGSCRAFRTFIAPLPFENENRKEYWERVATEGAQRQAESVRVENDRVCGEWLECRSGATTIGADGKEKQVCFDRFACRDWGENGECTDIVDDSDISRSFIYAQPAIADSIGTGFTGGGDFEEFTRRSGLARPGLVFNTGQTISGSYHPNAMSVEGDSASVLNFDFEKDVNEDNFPDGWIIQKPCEGSCSLDTKEVKSGVRSLRIGSVTSDASSREILQNRYSADIQLFGVPGKFVFTGEAQSYAGAPGSIDIRYRFFYAGKDAAGKYIAPNDVTREGWRAGDEKALDTTATTETITLAPSEKKSFSHIIDVPRGDFSNTFVIVDVIKKTEGVFSLRNTRFVPYNGLTRVFNFEQNVPNNVLNQMPNASSQPTGPVNWYKSVGCTNCKLVSSDGGQAFQIGKITSSERVCDGDAGTNKGAVCTKDTDCSGLGARCGVEKAEVAMVLDEMKAGESYSIKGKIKGTGTLKVELHKNPNEDELKNSYDTGSTGLGAFVSGLDVSSTGDTWKTFTITFLKVDSVESRKLAVRFQRADSGATALIIDDVVFSNTSRLEYSDIIWYEQSVCDGKCDLIRGSDVDIAAFLQTVASSEGEQTGMSTRVSNIRGNTTYVVSGWVNTRNLDQSTVGTDRAQTLVKVVQFNNDRAPESGNSGAVGSVLAVDTSNFTLGNQWQFFAKDFTTHSTTRSLRIDLMQDITGSVVFDDIQIRPVLRVAKETERPLLDSAPSCRLYPASSALQCDAIDDRGQYVRGWKGLCMERDPANPAVCIQWYPVDVIKDETNIFTKPENIGYQGPGPVYHCAVAKEKPLPPRYDVPRFVCVAFRGNPLDKDAGCWKFAIASDPKPAFYSLSEDDWLLGDSVNVFNPHLTANASGRIGVESTGADDGEVKGGCLEVTGKESSDDNRIKTLQFSSSSDCASSSDSSCYTDKLLEVYHKAAIYEWSDDTNFCDDDDHSGYDPRESYCAEPYCTGSSDAVFDGFTKLTTHAGVRDRVMDRFLVLEGVSTLKKVQRISRPLYCAELVKTVDDDGTNAAWASRMQGTYTLEKPVQFGVNTQCLPFSAAPAIDRPSDILRTLDTNNDFVPDQIIQSPLLLFSSGDTQNNEQAKLCTETHRGNMAFAYDATINTCVGGARDGSVCFTPKDCPGGSCPAGNVCTKGAKDKLGKSCKISSNCETSTPPKPADEPPGVCTPTTIVAPSTTLASTTLASTGLNRIFSVFSKIFERFKWDDGIQGYRSEGGVVDKRGMLVCSSNRQFCSDVLGSPCALDSSCALGSSCDKGKGTCKYYAPQILEVQANGVKIGQKSAITPTPVVSIGEQRSVQLAFTTNVPIDHLPIKAIEIDWGDGSFTRQTNLAIDQRRDMASPHRYTHVYGSGVVGTDIKIRIRVTDNWGWCNGADNISEPASGAGNWGSDCDQNDNTFFSLPVKIQE